jgi:D-xylulose reductase
VGMMNEHVPLDIPLIMVRGLTIETLFRYTNTFDKAVALVSAGKIDIKRLISKTFKFEDSIAAYEFAASANPDTVKVIIELD